jgi:uncharacterized protein
MKFLTSILLVFLSIIVITKENIIESFFYYPDRIVYSTPDHSGLRYNSFFIQTPDRQRLHLWQIQSKQNKTPKAVVIQAHGNAQNMSSHYRSLTWLLDAGYDLLSFDYRGYGQSSGSPNHTGLLQDCATVIDYVCKNNPQKDIYIFAQSLGGNLMLDSLRQNPSCIKKIVIESSFYSLQSIARNTLKKNPLSYLLTPLSYFLPHASKEKISNKIDVLVFHSNNDLVVDFSEGKKLFDNIKTQNKSFVQVQKAYHLGIFNHKKYQDKVLCFFSSSCK